MVYTYTKFGPFRIDTARRELWRGDELLCIQPRVFDCLAYLIEHRERAVGRDELVAAVWGRIDATDNLVDQIMLKARRAIEDTGEQRYAIRTVPRFGYAWISPVEVIEGSIAEPSSELETKMDLFGQTCDRETPEASESTVSEVEPAIADRTADNPKSRYRFLRKNHLITRLAVVVVILALASFVPQWIRRDSTPTRVQGQMAAILPATIDGTNEAAWMRLGLMDAIAERIRGAGQPVVPSDNVVAVSRGLAREGREIGLDDVAELARTTSAALVFEVHVEHTGDVWHVHLRNVYGVTGSLAVSGQGDDPLVASSIAADELIKALGLLPPVDVWSSSIDVRDVDRALHEVKSAIWSEMHDEARALLRRTATEHGDAPEVRFWMAEIDHQAGRDSEARSAFQTIVDDQALSGHANLLQERAMYRLGSIQQRRSDYAGALKFYDQVVERLDSMKKTHTSNNLLGSVLNARGSIKGALSRFEEALDDFTRARVALDRSGDQLALITLNNNVGGLQAVMGRHEEAISYFRQAAESAAAFHALQLELAARTNIASSALVLLDPVMAFAEEPRLSALQDRVSEPGIRQFVDLVRAQVFLVNGHLQRTAEILGEIRAGSVPGRGLAQRGWADLIAAQHALAVGNDARAARFAKSGLVDDLRGASPDTFAFGQYLLFTAQRRLNRLHDMVTTVEELRQSSSADNATPTVDFLARLAGAEYLASVGQAEAATLAFREVMDLTESRGRIPAQVISSSSAFVEHLIRQGQVEAAVPIAGRCGAWANRSFDAALLQLRLYHAMKDPVAWQLAKVRAETLAGEREIPAELRRLPAEDPITAL